jgi:hypothetical protein
MPSSSFLLAHPNIIVEDYDPATTTLPQPTVMK